MGSVGSLASSICAGRTVEGEAKIANSFRVTQVGDDLFMMEPTRRGLKHFYLRIQEPETPISTDINGETVMLLGTIWG